MPGMNVLRAAAAALHHIQEARILSSQHPNQIWYEREVRLLMESTLTLVREAYGSDAEIAKLLKPFGRVGHEDMRMSH